MNTMQKAAALAALLGSVLVGFVVAQGRGQGNGGSGAYGGDDTAGIATALQGIAPASLSETEKAGLLLMREEEKLARDVYSALAVKWSIPMFANIAQSEQSHMDSVKVLLDRYGIADPVGADVPGSFANADLRKLYMTLVAQGSRSLDEATRVGATIEDLDIRDLMDLAAAADNADIAVVYQNLLKGSRNHLRSFAGRFADWRTSYTPQFISVDLYRRIMTTDRETGAVITAPRSSPPSW